MLFVKRNFHMFLQKKNFQCGIANLPGNKRKQILLRVGFISIILRGGKRERAFAESRIYIYEQR